MEKKSLEVQFKFATTDAGANSFNGYGAVFSNTDSYGDIIAKGAFAKTLADHKSAGTTPAMLLNHDFFSLPIGMWTDLAEDDRGLKVSGVFLTTQSGNDAYTAAKAGAITGLSIGYQVVAFDISRDDDGNIVRTINEVKLLEISLVTFPANTEARVADVKSADLDGLKTALATITDELKSLKAKFEKKFGEECTGGDDCEDDECQCDPDDEDCDCDCDDDEEKAETKYNHDAAMAVKTLWQKLQQESHG